MEMEKYNLNNYNNIISELIKTYNDKTDFCKQFISLDVNDEFDAFMTNNKNVSELFDLCIKYLDNEIDNKQEIWNQIESNINKLI